MQLGGKPQTDSSILPEKPEGGESVSSLVSEKPSSSNTPLAKQAPTAPEGEPRMFTENTPSVNPDLATQSIINTGKKRLFFGMFVILLFITGVVVSYFMLKSQFGGSKKPDTVTDTSSGQVIEPTYTPSGLNEDLSKAPGDSVDSVTNNLVIELASSIEKTYENTGQYPWDKLGDKPIPTMGKVLNPANVSYFAWLRPENRVENDLSNYLDIEKFIKNEEVKNIRIIGYASWYAICFAPTEEDFLSKASFNSRADKVTSGGTHTCVKHPINESGDSKTSKDFEVPTPPSRFREFNN
jgi:hypothetical protein